jgi:hypothetical protein
MRTCFAGFFPILLGLLAALPLGRATAGETVDFSRDIRPILSDKCFRCHGPDEGERATSMRLDLRESALGELESGDHAIVPGDREASQLWARITAEDPDMRMPPAESNKQLAPAERDLLGRWIEQGANWSEHWAFIAPVRPSLPHVVQRPWVRNPIDTFVLAQLEAAQLAPSPEASREALVRRVTFDLTGLPAKPAEVDAFLADDRPDAYERLVDRLLASPRYGEHRARFWLDAARYGDTHGLHLDNERSMWPYRNWVIEAFNRNQPFDQFTIEQLAGDLLPGATLEQRVATGFNRCNVTTSEGGSIDQEYLVRYAVDRVETTATTWMGLTAGCAVCHDHKFDPVSQTEFYRLFGYFFSVSERAMDGNALLPPPAVKVPTSAQAMQHHQLQDKLAQAQRQLDSDRRRALPQLAGWIDEHLRANPLPSVPNDAILRVALDESEGETVAAWGPSASPGKIHGTAGWDAARVANGLRLDGKTHVELGDQCGFERDQPFSVGAWLYIDGEGAMTVLSRMDDEAAFRGYDFYLGEGRLYVHLVHQWDSNAIRVNTQQPLVRQKWQHVCFTYDGSSRASGVRIYLDGKQQELDATHDSLSDTIRTDQPLRLGRRRAAAPLVGMLDEVRIYDRELSADEVRGLAGADGINLLAARPAHERRPEEQQTLVDHFLARRDEDFRKRLADHRDRKDQLRRLEGEFPSTLVMEDMSEPRQAHVLIRGQYDAPGEPVQPGTPAVLPPLPHDAPPNRLTLARWLVDPAHPLTARVTVNRFWQQYFGMGIVATPEDFGSQGQWPSHPELLDWLAVEFVESGWDVKALHQLIVTSATYRQSSAATSEQYRRDPDNRMLARGPRYRLDAETIRDSALAVSGLMVEQLGGKSVRPYQPPGLWEAVGYTTSNTARFSQDHGAALYRRSMYTFWKRTAPPPTMQIFDAPSREVCTVRRPRTNTPAAALALMNDVQFVEAARHLAVVMHRSGDDDGQRLVSGFRRVTTRHPADSECTVLLELLADYRREYADDPAGAEALVSIGESPPEKSIPPSELAAWTMVASTLLNLDEAVTKW